MSGGDSFLHLAKIMSYRPARGRNIAVLWAYFDETILNKTNNPDGKRIPVRVLVGGCIAPAGQWEKLIAEWQKAVEEECIGYFHAKDFFNFEGEFKWFNKDNSRDFIRHNAFSDRLSDIIIEYVERILTFNSMVTIRKAGVRASYADAVKRSIYDFTKPYMAEEDLSIIFARHPDVSPWTLIKIFENLDLNRCLRGCGVFDPREMLPLQAADFVLHLTYRALSGQEVHSFKRVRESFAARGKTFASQIDSSADLSRVWDGTARNHPDVREKLPG